MNVNRNIADKLAAQRTLSWGATHDPVTGLPNRRELQEQLADAVAKARRNDEDLAVLLVDVDAFRIVNAAAGQAAGDALLIAAAVRLEVCAAGHLVARTGDNEFTVLITGAP